MKKFLSSAWRGSYALFAKSILFLTVLCSAGVWGQATLPVTRTAWGTTPTGWTDNGTSRNTNYACTGNNGGSLQATGRFYKVNFDSSPDKLTYQLKGSNPTNGDFRVQQSPDGTTWTDVQTFSTITGSSCIPQSNIQLLASSRYIQFILLTKTTGNVDIDDVNITKLAVSGITSTAIGGNWSAGSSWVGGIAPGLTDNVVIATTGTNSVKVDANITRAAGSTTTVNTGSILEAGFTYTNNGTTTVNGTFQINTNGFAGGTNDFVYGTNASLIFNHNNGSTYGPIDATHKYWPASNGPTNVTVNANSPINLGVSRTVPGTLQTAAGVLFPSANLTLNGSAQINTGGYFGNSPIYGSSSTLIYNTGTSNGAYGRASEWTRETGSLGSTPGFPNNLQLINNSTLDYPNTGGSPFSTPLGIAGNLIIESGSALYMDYNGGGTKSGRLTVGKNVTIDGNLSLGDANGGDLHIGGNWVRTGTFNPMSRAVFFNGTSPQTITGATTFDYLTINNAAGVTLASPVTNNLTLDFANGKITLGNNDLTIGSAGTITNATSTKYVVTNGSGRLKRTVSGTNVSFPVGNSAYNPVTLNNSGSSDIYGVRVADLTPSGANPAKTVNRQWITTEEVAGGSNLQVVAQYNAGETGSGFSIASDPFIGLYSATGYTQVAASLAGSNPFTASSNANFTPSDLTGGAQYFAVGKDNGFVSVPAKYVISNITPASPVAGQSFSATVTAHDAYNTASLLPSGSAFNFSTNGNAGPISGTVSGTIASGSSSVVVSGIMLPDPGTGVTITATNTGGVPLAAGTSAPFTVVGAATNLKFVNVTASGTAGSNLPAFTVEARRADNSVDTNFNGSITIAKASGPGNIGGTLTKAAVAGVANFNDIQFDAAGTYTITTTSGTLTSDTSGNIVIAPNPANAYFRSKGSGNWNAASSWESSFDGITWTNASVVPTSAANTVTITSGKNITVVSSITFDQLVIENGGQLSVNINIGKLTINDGPGNDVDVQTGGILQIFSTGTASNITYSDKINFISAASANISGKILVGDGTNFMGSGYGEFGFAQAAQIIWNNNAVLEWNTGGSIPGFADQTYFPGAAVSEVPVLRLTKIAGGNVGGGPTVINGLLQLNGVNVLWQGTGIKTFRNGIAAIGTGAMSVNSGSASWQIGNGTSTASAELGGATGNLTLTNANGINILSNCYTTLTSTVSFGTGTKFTVASGATLDFGFDSGNNPLVIQRNGNANSTAFELKDGGNLKISSPLGITNGTGVYTGNVQIGSTAANRVFSPNATYHFVGKTNQVTGNGLPAATSNKTVIVELEDNSYHLTTDNINYFNTGYGLDIRKGTVVVSSGNGFADGGGQSANLTMAAGTRFITTRPDIQPELTGNYTLADNSTIEFAYSKPSGNTWQSIRGSASFIYPQIEVSGADVHHRSANINLKANGRLLIKNGGILTSTVDSEQIVSVDNAQPATLELEANGIFRTASAVGFYGPYGGFGNISPSVRNNVNLNFNIDGIVEYARSTGSLPSTATDGNQAITAIATGYPVLRLNGDGIKTPDSKNLLVNNHVDVASAAATLNIPETPEDTVSYVVTAKKGIKVVANGNAIFKNNAQLMQDADAVNTGVITMEREATIPVSTFNQYAYWSSPVTGLDYKTIYPGKPTSALYHKESNNKFYTSSGAYIAGRSLAVRNPITATGSPTVLTAELKGTPYNSDLNYALAFTDASHGYNLVGNPYPSNLDINKLYIHSTNLDSTFLFWDNYANSISQQQGDNYKGYAYAKYNAVSGAGVKATGSAGNANGDPTSLSGLKEPNNILKVGQGFMVKATDSNAVLGFKNDDRLTAQTSAQFFGKTAVDSTSNRYWVEMLTPSNLLMSNAIVYFDNGTNDFSIDDSKMESSVSEAIFTNAGDEKVVINGRSAFSDTDVLKVGTRHFTTGLNQIRLGNKEGIFASSQPIYLKDKLTNTITNLSEGSYTFAAEAGESTGRFEIVYKPGGVLATDAAVKESIIVYRDRNNFHVKSPDKKFTELQLFDAGGRMIYSAMPNAAEAVIDGNALPNGVYILKINRSGEISGRKIIR